MNTKKASPRMSSRLQRTLLVLLAFIVLSATLPVSQARAATSYVGRIDTKITCNVADFTTHVTFYGAYDGQWISYRFHAYNSATGLFESTPWAYVQAWSSNLNNIGGDYHSPAVSGQIISVVTEAYFYNPTTGGWEYGGSTIADHRHSVYGLGGLSFCRVY